MQVAVVGNPGAWSTERLASALRAEEIAPVVVSATELSFSLSGGGVAWKGRPLPAVMGVIVKKLGPSTDEQAAVRLLPLMAWERAGVPIVSPPALIERVLDRFRMTLDLAEAGVPLPETILTESPDEAAAFVARHGRAVVKPRHTSKGHGMLLLQNPAEARNMAANGAALGRGPAYLQAFVQPRERGAERRDIGVVVIGGVVAGAYARVASAGEWRTTTAAGGRYAPANVTPEIEQIALKVSRVFGLDFTTVDVVETEKGPMVYEASALGGFRGLFEATGVDAARLTVRWALERFTRSRRETGRESRPHASPAESAPSGGRLG